ncbi:hypothetical protein KKA33_01715 [Patescibacteria group bacterium]|nr:hypothetical protein [Patescibacteria group bacterium]
MAEVPGNNTIEAQDEKKQLKKYISRRRICFAIILMGFLAVKYLWNKPNITPHRISAVEKQLNDEVNARLMRNKAFRILAGNAVYDPKEELEDDEIADVELPGSRWHREFEKDEEGNITSKLTEQSPQLIPTPKHCADLLIKLNECANEKLGTDINVGVGWLSNFAKAEQKARLRSIDSTATVESEGYSPHTKPLCVFDISQSDAYGRVPYDLDKNGEVIWVDKSMKDNEDIKKELRSHVRGMHILIAEHCAPILDGNGGICGPKRDPWHFTFPSKSECKPGTPTYSDKRQLLLDDPPFQEEGMDDVISGLMDGRLGSLKNYAKKKGRAVVELGKDGVKWVGEKGKDLKEWWKKKKQEKKIGKRVKKNGSKR